MSFRYCATNAVRSAVAAPTAAAALALHPPSNLTSGDPSLPTVWAPGAALQVDFDLNQIRNGDAEALFSGGLPGRGWGQAPGATLTRQTATRRSGAAAIELHGNPGAYAYFDVSAEAGAHYTLEAAARLVSGSGRAGLYVRDLETGRWLHGGGGAPAWGKIATTDLLDVQTTQAFVEASGTGWTYLRAAFSVPDAASVGSVRTRLRVYLALLAGAGALFDDVGLWPSVDFISVHGHTLTPASGPLVLHADESYPPATTRAELRPTSATSASACALLEAPVAARYWRASAAALPGGGHAALGTLVLGQASPDLDDHPGYPLKVREVLLQQRSGEPGRAGQAVVLARVPVRGVQCDVRHMSPDGRAQLMRLVELTAYGAEPVVVLLPLYDVETALYGRLLDAGGLQGAQSMFELAETSLSLQELPLFNLVP